jgi:CheY-like chemotaxis protein
MGKPMSRFSGEVLRILVAEDEAEHITILRRMLAGQKAELKHVDTLDGLLKQARVWGPDVILLDLRLDEQTDFMITARTMVSQFPSIPIIAWTTVDDEEAAMRALRAGLAAFITKGTLSGPELIRKMREAIARSEGPGKTMVSGDVQEMLNAAAAAAVENAFKKFNATATGQVYAHVPDEEDFEEELSESSIVGAIKQAKKWWPILGGLGTILLGIVGLGWQAAEYKEELASDTEVQALFEKHSKNGHASIHKQVDGIEARVGTIEHDEERNKLLRRYQFLLQQYNSNALEYNLASRQARAKMEKPMKSKELQDLENNLLLNAG